MLLNAFFFFKYQDIVSSMKRAEAESDENVKYEKKKNTKLKEPIRNQKSSFHFLYFILSFAN